MNGEWGEERPFLSVNFSSRAAPCTTHNALIPTGMTIAVAGTTIAVAGMSIDVTGMSIAVAGMTIAVAGMSIAVVGMSIAVVGMSIAVAGMSIAVAGMSIAVVETAVPHPSLPEKDTIALRGKGKRPFGWRTGEWQAGCGAVITPATATNRRPRRSSEEVILSKKTKHLWG